jgi:hypothetical protein
MWRTLKTAKAGKGGSGGSKFQEISRTLSGTGSRHGGFSLETVELKEHEARRSRKTSFSSSIYSGSLADAAFSRARATVAVTGDATSRLEMPKA